MKKIIIAAAVASTCLLSSAFAQTQNFTGFSAGLAANGYSGKSDVAGVTDMTTENKGTASVKAAYGFALGQSYVLGLGLAYDMGQIRLGSSAANNTALQGKNLMTASVEPGMAVSANTLVYGKVAYQAMNLNGEDTTGVSTSERFTGTSYGLGVRTMVARNVFLGMEVAQTNFMAKTPSFSGAEIKPSITAVSVDVSYKF